MMRLSVGFLVLVLVRPALAEAPSVEYPGGYRQWAHVKSMAIVSDKHALFAQFGGMHHLYANGEAMRAYTKGGTFADGSVIVFDLLEAKESSGAYEAGDRKFIGVMRKDRTKFKATGGWGFEGFKGDSRSERMVTDAKSQCFDCHQKQKDNDFVFSGYRP
jgi:hypothetical protein